MSSMRTVAASSTDRFRRPAARAMLGLALLLALPAGSVFSQQSPMDGTQFPGMGGHGRAQQDSSQNSPLYDPSNPMDGEKRLRAINAERQKTLTSDTAKLLKLATELNEEIAKSNPGALSAGQLRKVAEMEKLAHDIREKMIMSVRGPQFNMDAAPPYFPSPSAR
jgi:hypothetical protein